MVRIKVLTWSFLRPFSKRILGYSGTNHDKGSTTHYFFAVCSHVMCSFKSKFIGMGESPTTDTSSICHPRLHRNDTIQKPPRNVDCRFTANLERTLESSGTAESEFRGLFRPFLHRSISQDILQREIRVGCTDASCSLHR